MAPSTALTPTSTGTGGSTRLWMPSSRPSGHLTGGWHTGPRPCWTSPQSRAPRPRKVPPQSRGCGRCWWSETTRCAGLTRTWRVRATSRRHGRRRSSPPAPSSNRAARRSRRLRG
jgi:hypothetical protein